MDGLGQSPCHVVVVARVATEGYLHINLLDGFGEHKEGARRELHGEGDWLQVLDDLELHIYPAEFSDGGGFKKELSPSPEVARVALGWASQESSPDLEVVWRVVEHVPNPDEFVEALVFPEDVIATRAEDRTLYDLCPSLQVSEPAAFSEVPYQVNKTKIRK